MNFENWVKGTYQQYSDPTENTIEKECCKECDNELELYDGHMICYYCEICDDCKEYKENCDCINE